MKNQSLRPREERLNRPALRLIYDVEFGNAGAAVPRWELVELLKKYLARPIEHNDAEPELPAAMWYYQLKEGIKMCRTLDPDDVPRGLRLMIEGLHLVASGGGTVAQIALVDIATRAANIVRDLCETRPKDMAEIAVDRFEWPATLSYHMDWDTRNAAMMKAVTLGGAPPKKKSKISALPPKTHSERPVRKKPTESPSKIQLKESVRHKQEHRHIRHIYDNRLIDVLIAVQGWGRRMETKRARLKKSTRVGSGKTKTVPKIEPDWLQEAIDLPELDEKCADRWFEVGWQAIKFLTDGRPESLEGLDKLGRYKADFRANLLGNTPGVERGGKREGIKERLKENFAKHVLYPQS